jgi:hypothetical protein
VGKISEEFGDLIGSQPERVVTRCLQEVRHR